MDEVVITGYGVISALGDNAEAHIDACRNHYSGIQKINNFSKFPLGLVSQTNEDLIRKLSLSEKIHYSRTFLLAFHAVLEAIQISGLSPEQIQEAILISGSSVGGMDSGERFYKNFKENNQIKKEWIEVHDVGQSAEALATILGIKGFYTSISTACSSAANAILLGAMNIEFGRSSIAIVGGADALCQFTIDGFNSLMILSDEQNQPFDQNRKGLNLGEGAGFLILESKKHAERRNAKILAKISGYANTCDAFHQTASSPDGQGAFLAMTQALKRAGNPEIQYINTHGTATPNNDLSESMALKRVFNDQVPAFSSTKAMTGHTLAASGGIESVFSVLAIQEQMLWPNLFWENPIPETNLIPVLNFQKSSIRAVLSNSFGFGGNNTSLVFEK